MPADAPTAREGRWVPGPGADILSVLVDTAGPGSLVAEDLGVITAEVEELLVRFDLPGMKVLQFAFDGERDNPYLPRHHGEHSVVYTGTHDNDTTVGWWEQSDEETRDRVRSCLSDPEEAMPWALIRLAMQSTARLSVVPAQDLLGLGSESRMNTPGTSQGNWAWQAPAGAFDADLATRIHELWRQRTGLVDRPARTGAGCWPYGPLPSTGGVGLTQWRHAAANLAVKFLLELAAIASSQLMASGRGDRCRSLWCRQRR